MSATHLGAFGPTTKLSVGDSAPSEGDRFTSGLSDTTIRRWVLTADATVHIERNADATTSSAILVANEPYQIEMIGTDTLSYITASTANLYVTLLGA
jgi:hypothetical protein